MFEFSRSALLLGNEGINRLIGARVALFGVGGVGSYCAEALARSGICSIDLFDGDIISPSNINRQLIALKSTVGRQKADVMKERILDINPSAKVGAYNIFYNAENASDYDFSKYDYVIDAIDTVASKLILIERSQQAKTPIISCMGTGNKLDPTKFQIADITKSHTCPLARVMRMELKKRSIENVKVLFSSELPIKPYIPSSDAQASESGLIHKRQVPGSVSFVPSVAGLIIAGEVIKDIVEGMGV